MPRAKTTKAEETKSAKAKPAAPKAAKVVPKTAVAKTAPVKAAPAKAVPRKVAPKAGVKPSISEEERQRMIAVAAYFRAEKRGFHPGYEEEDWRAAEGEINQLLGIK